MKNKTHVIKNSIITAAMLCLAFAVSLLFHYTFEVPELASLENDIDGMKKELTANHFTRLADGDCSIDVSPYYASVITRLERVADHLVNVGYSIVNPIGSQKE